MWISIVCPSCFADYIGGPAFIEVFLEDNKLYCRPADSQETEGVLLYEN